MDLNFRVVDIHFFSILLVCILIISVKIKTRKPDYTTIFFLLSSLAVIFMLIIDLMTWLFHGIPGETAKRILYIFNGLFFAFIPLVSVFFLCYIDVLMNGSFERLKRRLFYTHPLLLTIAITAVLLPSGGIFTINDDNIYQRGFGAYLMTAVCWLTILYTAVIIIRNRQKLNTEQALTVSGLVVFPFIGNLLQLRYCGTSIVLPATSICLLQIYIFMEIKEEERDYLTGLLNRQSIEHWMQHRINHFTKSKGFSLILIDLNGFKSINDRYGHQEGDSILVSFAHLLKRMVKSTDKVGRFGGDEFIIFFESDDPSVIEDTLSRISKQLKKENLKRRKDYEISFSYGSAVYQPEKYNDIAELFNEADQKMYAEKNYTAEEVMI